jgi:hypothetical protein
VKAFGMETFIMEKLVIRNLTKSINILSDEKVRPTDPLKLLLGLGAGCFKHDVQQRR